MKVTLLNHTPDPEITVALLLAPVTVLKFPRIFPRRAQHLIRELADEATNQYWNMLLLPSLLKVYRESLLTSW